MSEVRKIQIQDGKGNIYHPQTVSEQVLGLDERLEGLAKETYVDEKIAAIPEIDLSDIENNILTLEENKADKIELNKKADITDVDSKLSLKAEITYVDDKISQIPEVDLTPINNDILRLETNKADKVELESTDNKVAELEESTSQLESEMPKMVNWDNVQKIIMTKSKIIEGAGRLIKSDFESTRDEWLLVKSIDGKMAEDIFGYSDRDIIINSGGNVNSSLIEWQKSIEFTCKNPGMYKHIWVEML